MNSNLVRKNNYPYAGFLPEWGEKQLDFLGHKGHYDFLEGPIRSGKSVVAIHKFGMRVSQSSEKQFVISAKEGPVAKRNLIDNEAGLLAQFGHYITKGTDSSKGNYYVMHTTNGEKLIYIIGFKNRTKWEEILGGTLGGCLLDEVNLASVDYLKEMRGRMMTVEDWFIICTANPDNPSKEVYQILNRCRPLKKYSDEVPEEIKKELRTQSYQSGYTYWYFTFRDNPRVSEDIIKEIEETYAKGSLYYKTKIMGIRAVGEGTVFGLAINNGNLLPLDKITYNQFTFGIDLGAGKKKSAKSMISLQGHVPDFKYTDCIDGKTCKSIETNDMVNEFVDFIQKCQRKYKGNYEGIYIDGFGAIEVVMQTLKKKLRDKGISIKVNLSWKFGESVKTETGTTKGGGRKEREELIHTLLHHNRLRFNSSSKWAMDCLDSLKKLIYDDKGFIMDNNDIWNDFYDTLCYGITRFTYQLIRR